LDEDLTAIAVKGILEHGYPVLPTGVLYIRALPYHYLVAASVDVFGFSEFALRLPSALFGAGTILIAYFFTRRLFDWSIALIVAGLVCVSFDEVEMGRYARFYTPFAFFYLVTVFAFYHYYVEGKGKWRSVVTIFAFLAISLHSLGFTLALLFLMPLLVDNYRVASRSHLLAQFAVVMMAFMVSFGLIDFLFDVPASSE
jgi:4-amino-4-deoxy-L-arabinose transferase-like glycosyltransferase